MLIKYNNKEIQVNDKYYFEHLFKLVKSLNKSHNDWTSKDIVLKAESQLDYMLYIEETKGKDL
jgi:hypothetical protein